MKYKTVKIPRPEWCQIGTVVTSRKIIGEFPIIGMSPSGRVFVDKIEKSFHTDDLTPVPAWEPTPGEWCAFWDDESDDHFVISTYSGSSKYGHCDKSRYYRRVARIAGVDCACSVKELKARTEWL